MDYYEYVDKLLTTLAACSKTQKPNTSSRRNYHNWTGYSKKSGHYDAVTAGTVTITDLLWQLVKG
jgi:hypothetical protein